MRIKLQLDVHYLLGTDDKVATEHYSFAIKPGVSQPVLDLRGKRVADFQIGVPADGCKEGAPPPLFTMEEVCVMAGHIGYNLKCGRCAEIFFCGSAAGVCDKDCTTRKS